MEERQLKIEKTFVLRKIANDYMIVPVGKCSTEYRGFITVNETGALLWEMLTKGATRQQLVDRFLEEYEVDEQTAGADVDRFIELLQEERILSR